jgi:hypothetical protein
MMKLVNDTLPKKYHALNQASRLLLSVTLFGFDDVE